MISNFHKYAIKDKRNRLLNQPAILLFLIILFFASILTRLFWLQVLKGNYYQKLSDENRIRLISMPPIRGKVLDRNGKILVDNRLLYSLSMQPRLVAPNKWPDLRDRLVNLLNLPKESLEENYQKGIQQNLLRIIFLIKKNN